MYEVFSLYIKQSKLSKILVFEWTANWMPFKNRKDPHLLKSKQFWYSHCIHYFIDRQALYPNLKPFNVSLNLPFSDWKKNGKTLFFAGGKQFWKATSFWRIVNNETSRSTHLGRQTNKTFIRVSTGNPPPPRYAATLIYLFMLTLQS